MLWTPEYLLLIFLAVSVKKKKKVAINMSPSSRASYPHVIFVFNHLWVEKAVRACENPVLIQSLLYEWKCEELPQE